MYQLDGGRVVGGGGIIKSTKAALSSTANPSTGTPAVSTNVAKLYSSNGSAQHAAAAKHAAVVAHLTGMSIIFKPFSTAAHTITDSKYFWAGDLYNIFSLLAQQAAIKVQRVTKAASGSSTPRNGGQTGNGATSRGMVPRHQGGPYPRPQSAMLPHTEKMAPTSITGAASGTTTVSTVASGSQPISDATSGQLVPLQGNSRNPFICIICNNSFQNPCLLACYHTFCAACLRGRIAKDGKLVCPLCG